MCRSAPVQPVGSRPLPVASSWAGVSCEAKAPEARAYFDVPRAPATDGDFYRLPYPNDARRTAAGVDLAAEGPDFLELNGRIALPIFQQGMPPYAEPEDGGAIERDAAGAPTLARTENVCFALTVPKATMPTGGWPLLIYAHGTGGSFRGAASELAADLSGPTATVQAATLATDLPEHGARRGASTRSPADLYSLLTRAQPVNTAAVLPFALRDLDATGHLAAGEWHPVLGLFQQYFDSVDPVNYARRFAAEPPTGDTARHLFMTYGQGDTYSTEPTMQSLARAAGFPIVRPVLVTFGLGEVDAPLTGNRTIGTATRTQGLRQYAPDGTDDGHFVATRTVRGREDTLRFVRGALAGETPVIGQ